MKRKWVLLIAAVVFIGLAYFLNKPSYPEIVKAGSTDNVFGWAWSENIGWISFNSTNTGAAVNYGVSINPSTGLFSGYAWAGGGEMGGNATATIGWISFNSSDLTGCPLPPCEARLDLTAGGTYCGKQYDVCGWARALVATSSPGDWDGWIRLKGTATDGTPYGISLNPATKEFEGLAAGWDDSTSTAVIGWISFNCKNESWCPTSSYSVKTSLSISSPPTVAGLSYSFPNPCLQSRIPTLSWTTNAKDPHDYQIQIAASPTFAPLIIDEKVTNVFGSNNSWTPPCNYCCDIPPYNNISFGGGTYHWRVRVHDNNGTSTWATNTFITKANCYPYPDFTITPSKPKVDMTVTFNNNSSCSAGCSSYFWDFGNGMTSTTSGNPTTTYSSSGYKTASLRVTDSHGYTCTTTKTFYVGSKLPWWKEIIPF